MGIYIWILLSKIYLGVIFKIYMYILVNCIGYGYEGNIFYDFLK